MNKQKYCCFYVSDIHLVTMLLPYINEKIKENKEIITIFETNISESAKKVIESVNFSRKDKEKFLNIGWDKCKDIKKVNTQNKIVIIMGSSDFIEEINKELDKKKDESLIINCYEMFQAEKNIDHIYKIHSKIVNTKGECEINKFSQNEQKKMTIKSQ